MLDSQAVRALFKLTEMSKVDVVTLYHEVSPGRYQNMSRKDAVTSIIRKLGPSPAAAGCAWDVQWLKNQAHLIAALLPFETYNG